ncbi:MAG: DoxX family protein [Chromatiales bacterium]|nr:DoxX family protein [Chromatiales bacterium]
MIAQSSPGDALGKLVLRLSVGGLMLFHGVAKIMHAEALGKIGERLTGAGLPSQIAYGVYLGEVLAPILVILGLFCRLGGALMAVNMLVAIGLVHMADLAKLTGHGGWALELQGLFLFGSVAIMLLGSGRFAIRPD